MPTIGEATVDGIMWYLAGRNSRMPETIAEMTEPERERVWNAAKKLVRERGEDYAMAVVETIARAGKD
jgi:hypothetical protein